MSKTVSNFRCTNMTNKYTCKAPAPNKYFYTKTVISTLVCHGTLSSNFNMCNAEYYSVKYTKL